MRSSVLSRPDVLMIGTGPLMLIEGASLSEAGARVMIVDTGSLIGGSWKSADVLGFSNIEVGVHLVENRPAVNAYLADIVGSALRIESKDDNFGILFRQKIPMNVARVALNAFVSTKALLSGRLDKSKRFAVSAGRAVWHLNEPFCYPEQGFSVVLRALEQRLRAAGAVIRFNLQVNRLVLTPELVCAETDQGIIYTKQVVISSRAHSPIEGADDLGITFNVDRCYSVVLHLEGPPPSFSGYVEVIGDSFLKRVRNITAFAVPQPAVGQTLLCVQLKKPGPTSDEKLGKSILDALIGFRLVDYHVDVRGLHRDTVIQNTITDKGLRAIEARYGPRIRVLPSTDFAGDLDSRLHSCPPDNPVLIHQSRN